MYKEESSWLDSSLIKVMIQNTLKDAAKIFVGNTICTTRLEIRCNFRNVRFESRAIHVMSPKICYYAPTTTEEPMSHVLYITGPVGRPPTTPLALAARPPLSATAPAAALLAVAAAGQMTRARESPLLSTYARPTCG